MNLQKHMEVNNFRLRALLQVKFAVPIWRENTMHLFEDKGPNHSGSIQRPSRSDEKHVIFRSGTEGMRLRGDCICCHIGFGG